MPEKPFNLPADDERVIVIGHTGSGKTQLGGWLLSTKKLMSRPHFIVDYKGDDLLNSLKNAREIDFEVPKKPGLYILHTSLDLADETEKWMRDLWARENLHLYVDEGYMLPQPRKGAFDALLTQGRGKGISITTLTQRPTQMTRFAFSEASHVSTFHLTDERDWQTVEKIVPRGFKNWLPAGMQPPGTDETELPEYYSRWYTVRNRARYILRPVPDADSIRSAIDGQLEPRLRWL
jgi:hypothetical protein